MSASEATTKRGIFIVIEGLDRSGKSTQAAALFARCQASNIPSRLMKFPDRTTAIGKMIDAYLRSEADIDDHAIHLLFSANRWELASTIEQTLASGTTIICDRYAFSGVSFSASKGLPVEWCRGPDVSLPAPDLTFFFDISPEKARERGGYGEERYEKEEIQTRVRTVFNQLLGEANEKGDCGKIVVIDAGRDVDAVGSTVWEEVQQFLPSIHQQMTRLWHSHQKS